MTVERPWRCFVAVPITDELKAGLRVYVDTLRQAASFREGWSWTDADGWHVTLAFLGPTEPDRVPELGETLGEVAGPEAPFALEGATIGAFPSARRARVVWYGFADPEGRLRRLAERVRSAVGLPREDRFRPHLTLARARDRSGADVSAARSAARPPTAVVPVDRLVLYRSHLGRGPARYEALTTAMLGAAR